MKGETRSGTKRSLVLIFFIMLLDIVGLTILSPGAPYIVRRYNSDALVVAVLMLFRVNSEPIPAYNRYAEQISD